MAKFKAHYEQGLHNKNFADDLISVSPIKYKDWVITVAFYSAVHLIEAYFDKTQNLHSDVQAKNSNESPHEYRNRMVQMIFSDEVASCYTKLYRLSRFSRYLEFNGATSFMGKQITAKGTWIKDKDVNYFYNQKLIYSYLNQSRVY